MWKTLGTLALVAGMALPGRAEDVKGSTSQIVTRMESMSISLDFSGSDLGEVVDFLHETSGVNFVLSKAVQDKEKAGELKVDLKLENLPLRTAMRLMLEMHDLVAIVEQGVVVIRTKDERGANVKMQIFDVKDLLVKINDEPGPSLELKTTESDMPTVGLTEARDTPFSHPDTLLNIIRSATGGDTTWGKDGVSIELHNGLLIVNSNPEVIKEVQELVLALRQFR